MSLENKFAQHQEVVDKYVDPTEDYQMTTRDYVVRVDASGGSVTVTLPPVAESKGRFYSVQAKVATPAKTVTVEDKDDSESWGGDYTFVANNQGGIFYSDGLKWTAIFGGFGVLSTRITLTSQQVKALRAEPQVLVPSLGNTKLIEFLSATLYLNYGSNVFTESADNLAIKYNDGSGVAVSDDIETTGFIDQNANTITRAVPVKDAIVPASDAVGKALVLHNIGDGEFGGNAANDSTLTIWTLFRMIETG